MKTIPAGLLPIEIDAIAPVQVGPGCLRRDLPSRNGVRLWVVDMEAGGRWPHIDYHDAEGKDVLVFSGELIEGDQRYLPGTYLHYGPQSAHRPRTNTGVRLFGMNLVPWRDNI